MEPLRGLTISSWGKGQITAVPEPGSVLGILVFGVGLPASRVVESRLKRTFVRCSPRRKQPVET